jgi:rhodanese-related sulfurtransferase
MDGGEAKRQLNEQFARVAKAMAHPKRVELLDVLAQGERSVDTLAATIGSGVSTTSANLQVLRQAQLVATRNEGTRVFYRLAGDEVASFLVALRHLAAAQLSEVDRVVRDYFEARGELEALGSDELWRRVQDGGVIVLDVRPPVEFASGHIPGAMSIPLDELAARLDELPAEADIVAYCRGTYCVLAPEAVTLLHHHGRRARRLRAGLPEWRLAGLPVAVGEE